MGFFEIVLANAIRASRQQNKQPYQADTELPMIRATIARLVAVAALFAVTIVVLDAAGEHYERQLATSAVAATRQ